jgi:hypothetical protein
MQQTYKQPSITDVITAKQQRVEKLLTKQNEFDDIISLHNATKLKLKVGSFFYHFKKFFLTLIIIALLAGSLTLLIYPKIILQSEELGDFLISINTLSLVDLSVRSFANSVYELKLTYDINSESELIEAIFYHIIVSDLLNKIRLFGALVLIIAFIMIFSVRQTTKLRKVKKRIAYLEAYSVSIIKDFTDNINAEAEELKLMENIIKKD